MTRDYSTTEKMRQFVQSESNARKFRHDYPISDDLTSSMHEAFIHVLSVALKIERILFLEKQEKPLVK